MVTYCAQTSARMPQATQCLHSVASWTWPSASCQRGPGHAAGPRSGFPAVISPAVPHSVSLEVSTDGIYQGPCATPNTPVAYTAQTVQACKTSARSAKGRGG